MRQLAFITGVLAVTAATADADPAMYEYGVAMPLRPAEQLVESSCDMSIELNGAIAEVEIRQRLRNPGPGAVGMIADIEQPRTVKLVGMSLQRGRGKPELALQVSAPFPTEQVTAQRALGADPAVLIALPGTEDTQAYRVIAQPLDAEQEITVSTQWLTTAEIRDGALQLAVAPRGEGQPLCHGLVHVAPGPGARVERIRLNHAEIAVGSTATFESGAKGAMLSAVLAFKRSEPLAWTQSMTLGEGYVARALTVLTPAIKNATSRRALLLIDSSRSMELVGRHNVQKLVRTLGSALPPKAELEAVLFDRSPQRVLGAWKPVTSDTLTTIESAIHDHIAGNGSDTAAALAFARKVMAGTQGQTMVILVTDGVLGDLAPDALTQALGASPSELDLHAILLAPGRMDTPDSTALRTAIQRVGGSYVHVATKDLDTALTSVDDWLRPASHELAVTGFGARIPDQLRAGTGVVAFDVVKAAGKLKLTGHSAKPFTITAAGAPAASIAQLALDSAGSFNESTRAKLRERYPVVDEAHALVVLSSTGSVAANRRSMIAGGGPFTRMVDVADPKLGSASPPAPPITIGGSAIDRTTITLLLRTYLQPAAFTCYQKAIALNGSLSGTAMFKLEIGRGELTRAHVNGIGDATFDACLLEAAYKITPPLPNPDYNIDDRTVVNYPLTFSVREQKPFILAGDADSSSPLDIDSIQGGVPATARRGPIKAGDTSTPLGNLRPTPMP